MGLRVAVQQQERRPVATGHQVNFCPGCRDPAALEFRKEVGHCGTPTISAGCSDCITMCSSTRRMPRLVVGEPELRDTFAHADDCNAENYVATRGWAKSPGTYSGESLDVWFCRVS